MKKMLRFFVLPLLALALTCPVFAQIDPTLSIQGILKKSNGVAVEDGTYNITFKLYTVANGGSAIWTEAQSDVEVSSGIYSATLGVISPLNVAFDQLYYLGVTVGSTELLPRILLTSAPYALALIGQTNKFPSAGVVKADSIVVAGGVLARGGAPGANGVSKNGYAFTGNSGDKDSGLFSTADGKVALYVNNTEVLAVTPANAAVTGNLTANNLTLPNDGKLIYNTFPDWRLVDVDNLESGADEWNVYNAIAGQGNGWNNTASAGIAPVEGGIGTFAGFYLYPSDNNQVLKKYYDLSGVGTFSHIKVKFKYYFFDTWGSSNDDRAWAAFAEGANGSQFRLAWDYQATWYNNLGFTNEFLTAASFDGNNALDNADFSVNGEMTASKSGNGFWLFFGAALNEDTNNESYGVGMIEVWVK